MSGANVTRTKEVTFQAAATTAVDGTIFENGGVYKTLRVKVKRSAGTSTLLFKHTVDRSGEYYDLVGTKISDTSLTMGISTTGTAEVWEFDITASMKIKLAISAISGASVDVAGMAVG